MYTFQFSFTVYMSNNDSFIYSIVLETEVEDADSKHMETKGVKENDEEAVDQQEGESQEECSNDSEGFDANKCYKSWEEYTDGQELSR